MYEKRVTIINKTGLHARPAVVFVKTAAQYKASILVSRADKPGTKVNAKSMVFVLSLSASQGTEICITAEGADEQAAVEALAALTETGFDEG